MKPAEHIAAVESRFRAKIARAVLEAITTLRRQWKPKKNPHFTEAARAFTAILEGSGLPASATSLREVITEAIQWSASSAVATLDRPLKKKFISELLSFNLLSPQMVDFIRAYTFSLITQISNDTRAAIQAIVLRGFIEGFAPREQGVMIREIVGLTPRQSVAVMNYRTALQTGNYAAGLERALRDGRFDSTLRRLQSKGGSLSQEQIDRMVARYTERQRKYRAEMIARTETIRAANAGTREAWRQATEQGLLSATARQKWIVATDERLCPICRRVPGMNPAGVPLNGYFSTPEGPVQQPPLHPMCRCALGLVL